MINIANLRILNIDQEGEQLLTDMSAQRLNEQGEPHGGAAPGKHIRAVWEDSSSVGDAQASISNE